MKKAFLLILTFTCVLSITLQCFAADGLFVYKKARILGLWEFLQSNTGGRHANRSLVENFSESQFSQEFKKYMDEFKKIRDEFITGFIQFPKYPRIRGDMSISIMQLMEHHAALAEDLDEFDRYTRPLMPHCEHARMMEILFLLDPVYEKLVWSPNLKRMDDYFEQLNKCIVPDKLNKTIAAIGNFYGRKLDAREKFTVSGYPILKKMGGTFATVTGNVIQLQILMEKEDFQGRAGVLVHELCHYLHSMQSSVLQHEIESAFKADSTGYGVLARDLFDEILACALGNGYGYSTLFEETDPSTWYSVPEIDRTAKAIYPVVEDYIKSGRAMDPAFIQKLIDAYRTCFPDGIYKLSNRTKSIMLCTDGNAFKSDTCSEIFKKHFKPGSGISLSSPIDHPFTFQDAGNTPEETAVILVFAEQSKSQALAFAKQDKGLQGKMETLENTGSWLFVTRHGLKLYVLIQLDDPDRLEQVLRENLKGDLMIRKDILVKL